MSFIANLTQQLKKNDPLSGLGQYRALELVDQALAGPKAAEAPTGPTDADIAAAGDLAAQDEQRRLARGRTATILTGGAGLANMGQTSKVLLGQ